MDNMSVDELDTPAQDESTWNSKKPRRWVCLCGNNPGKAKKRSSNKKTCAEIQGELDEDSNLHGYVRFNTTEGGVEENLSWLWITHLIPFDPKVLCAKLPLKDYAPHAGVRVAKHHFHKDCFENGKLVALCPAAKASERGYHVSDMA